MILTATRRLSLVVIACVALVACGGGGSKAKTSTPSINTVAAPQLDLHDVLATTKEAGTAHIDHQMIFDSATFSGQVKGSGSLDLRTGDNELTLVLDDPLSFVGSTQPGDVLDVKTRFVDGDVYVSFPAYFRTVGIEAQWVVMRSSRKGTAEGVTSPFGQSLTYTKPFLSARLGQPSLPLDALAAYKGESRYVGTDSVLGKRTNHYSIDLQPLRIIEAADLAFVFGKLDATKKAALEQQAVRASSTEVWVDDLGRLRRFRLDADLSLIAPYFNPPSDPKLWHSLTLDWKFSDFGSSVSIAKPEGDIFG